MQKKQREINSGSPETKEMLRAQLAEKPGTMLEAFAKNHGLTVAEVIELLPNNTWKKMDKAFLIDLLKTLPDIGKVTTVIHTADVIFEFSGHFPRGGMAHGFYNLSFKSPFHGHIRINNCQSIYLIERPFMNTQTVSVQFVNTKGDVMFKVFAGRDENHHLVQKQVETMRQWFTDDFQRSLMEKTQ